MEKTGGGNEMNYKASYHVHSTFCDGGNTPEEMVQAAIDKGFTDIGFSSHGIYPFAFFWHMSLRDYKPYCDEIRRLKAVYADKIQIFMGFEADYLAPLTMPDGSVYAEFDPDYLIGSVHYIPAKEGMGFFTVDGSVEEVAEGVKSLFVGDGRKAVTAYYELEREMIERADFQILGHPDVIRKRNGVLRFFDEAESWYIEELEKTASAAALRGKIVEINTGGISRGAMDDVYPSAAFLALLRRYNVPIVINSDSHRAAQLDVGYDRAAAAALKAGYTESMYLRNGGWVSVPLRG